MAKPVRNHKYLGWIRTLPCSVSGCKVRRIEAHHTGPRGMSQRADDTTAIPLCWCHHEEFHRIGRRQFATNHQLNISAIVAQLNLDCPAYLLRRREPEEDVA